MKRTKIAFTVALIVAAVAVGMPNLLVGQPVWAGFLFLLGGLWWVAHWRNGSLGSIAFALFTAICVIGVRQSTPPAALVIGLSAALAAWELEHFEQSAGEVLQPTAPPQAMLQDDMISALERDHLRVMGWVIGIGLVAGILATLTSIRISFWVEAFIVLAAMIALRVALRAFNQESGE